MGIIRSIKSYRFKKKVSRWTDQEIDRNIRIQGTTWDRKRTLTDRDLKAIKRMLRKGVDVHDIAPMYGVDIRTIRYAIDPDYRVKRIAQSSGKHCGGTEAGTRFSRIMYKKTLVSDGLIVK